MEISSRLYKELERIYGYEEVNHDPLSEVEIPESLASIDVSKNGMVLKYEYLGDLIGKKDVIRETADTGKVRFLSIADVEKYTYNVYNFDKSKKIGRFIWDHFMDLNCDKYLVCQELKEKVKNK